ncbi:MAG: hypothetical protein WCH97_07830 [Actinomycetes bacterium]
MARPLLLDQKHAAQGTRAQAVVYALEQGCYLTTAARYAGLSPRTLHNYLASGRSAEARADTGEKLDDKDQQFLHFLHSVKKALADQQLDCLAVIQEAAGKGTWQAAAWLLERRTPAQWAKRDGKQDELSEWTEPMAGTYDLLPA